MIPRAVELNDVALQVGGGSGVIAASPGFALLKEGAVLLGAEAERQHRIYPTQSHARFWHELDMKPLPGAGRIRHHADLAWFQLQELARQAELDGEAIFAVPGHYGNEQLGVLLGLARQCPFELVGIVDSALAAASEAAEECVVHVGLHLHQCLLTRMRRKEGGLGGDSSAELVVQKVVQVPQFGRQQLLDALLRIANDAFVRQCRFNPQHDASSEQQLYSLLADWAQGGEPGQHEQHDHVTLELQAGGASHAAKLPRQRLLAACRDGYQELLRPLRQLTESPGGAIVLDHRLALLPGAVATLGSAGPARVAPAEAALEACLRHRESIVAGEGIQRIRALPAVSVPAAKPRAAPRAPTHVLFRNRALPVDELRLVRQANGSGNALALDLPGPDQTLGTMHSRSSEVVLDCGASEFRLNGALVSGVLPLRLGDRVGFAELADELLLIEVRDG